MEENASQSNCGPSKPDLELLGMLNSNPRLKLLVQELAAMGSDPEYLAKSAEEIELKAIGLVRRAGRSALQGWAQAANERCERLAEQERPKGRHRRGKKNCAG